MAITSDWAGSWQVQTGSVNANLTPDSTGNTFTTAVGSDPAGNPTLNFTAASKVWNGLSISLPANVASIAGSVTDSAGKTDTHLFILNLTGTLDSSGALVNKTLNCCLGIGQAAQAQRSNHDDSGGSWTAHEPPPTNPPPGYRHRRHRKPRYSRPQEPQAEA